MYRTLHQLSADTDISEEQILNLYLLEYGLKKIKIKTGKQELLRLLSRYYQRKTDGLEKDYELLQKQLVSLAEIHNNTKKLNGEK